MGNTPGGGTHYVLHSVMTFSRQFTEEMYQTQAQLDSRDQATGHKWYLADLVGAESKAKGMTA